jgi:hypothetical protein
MDFLRLIFKILQILQILQCYYSLLVPNDGIKVVQARKKNYKPFTIRIRHIPKSNDNEVAFETPAIILTKDLKDVVEFNEKASLCNEYPEKLKFIIAPENHNDKITLKFEPLEYQDGHISQYAYFVKNKPEIIELTTFEFFTKDTCTVNHTVINTFDKKMLNWKQELKYEEKFMNFNNCEISIGLWDIGSYMAYFSSGELMGITKDFVEILSQIGNFTPKYVETNSNETYSERVDYLLKFELGYYSLHNLKVSHITKTFHQYEEQFLISQSESYSTYEKLILPFDKTTWYLLILTFGLTFAVIFLARFASQAVRNRIFGRDINSPAFNVVGAFFGIGQVRLPHESIPRFILMCFILFFLIIRTAYQGVLFDMMTKDMRKPLPKTIKELYLKNYTILVESMELKSNFSFLNHLTELLYQSARYFE